MLLNTLAIAKIRSNLHTGQYVGSIPSDHRQGQALVRKLSLPGNTRQINNFLCMAAQKRDGELQDLPHTPEVSIVTG